MGRCYDVIMYMTGPWSSSILMIPFFALSDLHSLWVYSYGAMEGWERLSYIDIVCLYMKGLSCCRWE